MGYKLQKIYIGQNQVRPSGWGWQPWADTILYLPFETDLLDHSQTWLALTNSWNVRIDNGAAYFDGSSYLYSKSFTQINQTNFTASVWFKNTSTANTERVCLHQFRYYSGYRGYCMWITWTDLNAQNTYLKTNWSSTTVTANERHNLILVRDSANQTSQFYFDGQAITMQNENNYPELYWWLGIWWWMWYNSTMWEYKWIGYMSNVIYENKAWTAQEVANYYNQTKGDYQNVLPSTYQEVEYIQSDGNQYINTWVKANSTISTEIVMQPNMSYVSEYAIFWDAWSADALFLMEYSWKYRLHNWGNYWDFATVTDTKTTITTNNTWITINGTSYTLNAGSSYSNNNIWLFYTWDDTSWNRTKRGRFKLFSFKIWSSWTLTRDFIPCYRISDGVIWLYDLVNDVFYTNQWTGTFTKWPDVS